MNYELFKKISATTLRHEPADLVLKNANIVNVFTDEIIKGDLAVSNGYIAAIGEGYIGKEEIDLQGKYLLPGLLDAHIHLESTISAVHELVHVAAYAGTTTLIADPHEAANVSGTDGIDYILDQTSNSPANVYVMMPSCVPATDLDDNGYTLNALEMEAYLNNPRILGLGEVMNCPGVVYADEKLHEKLKLFSDKVCDGHAPFLSKDELSAYALAGINTDHEATSYEYAMEEVRRGIHVHIREGSAAHNLEAIVKGIVENNTPIEHFSFCTDDKHIEDTLKEGHISNNIRKAIRLGLDPLKAIKMATINTAHCYKLSHLGALAPGYQADMIVVDNLTDFTVEQVYYKGKRVDNLQINKPKPCPDHLRHTIHLNPLSEQDFILPIKQPLTSIISIEMQQITTKHLKQAIPLIENYQPQNGLNKIAAIERHQHTGKIGIGICANYGIVHGAIASSVSHDSHNILVIGDNDRDMALAVNEIIRTQGGYTLIEDGKVYDTLPLPIMGLIADESYQKVNEKLKKMIEKAHLMGVPKAIDPFITLSFLALPVIPEIRITPRGLVDTVQFKVIEEE